MFKSTFTIILLFGLTINVTAQQGIKVFNDLSYVSGEDVKNDTLQRLNLAIPENQKSMPLLIWIGGGAWSYVNRNMEMDMAEKFAKEGIAFASIGHRLSTATWRDPSMNKGIKHPEHIKDLASAFRWLYDHAQDYGYDRERIFVGGYSSGGHLAALLSVDEKYLKKHGLSKANIQGVIPIAGAYDIDNYYDVFANGTRKELAELHVKAVFGDTKTDFANASPTSYVENMTVPMLLISESNTYNYTKIFEDKIRTTDFQLLEVIHITELDHAGLWRNLSFDEKSKYRKRMIEFISRTKAPSVN